MTHITHILLLTSHKQITYSMYNLVEVGEHILANDQYLPMANSLEPRARYLCLLYVLSTFEHD